MLSANPWNYVERPMSSSKKPGCRCACLDELRGFHESGWISPQDLFFSKCHTPETCKKKHSQCPAPKHGTSMAHSIGMWLPERISNYKCGAKNEFENHFMLPSNFFFGTTHNTLRSSWLSGEGIGNCRNRHGVTNQTWEAHAKFVASRCSRKY